jgi:hypothetical protein
MEFKMLRLSLFTVVLVAIFAASMVFISLADRTDDLSKIREATAGFQSTFRAQAADYEPIPGFDFCFQSMGVGGMGYHFIHTGLLDTTVDVLQPEALVFAPDRNGSIQLGAVEYLVPSAAWDAEHTTPPHLLGQSFHLNEKLEMYILLVWIWLENPSGLFEDWNPNVSCPDPVPVPWQGSRHWR